MKQYHSDNDTVPIKREDKITTKDLLIMVDRLRKIVDQQGNEIRSLKKKVESHAEAVRKMR